MTERERLIELMTQAENEENDGVRAESIADFLISNGVIILPCKVGDVIYYIYYNTIIEYQVATIIIYRYCQRIFVLGRSQYFEFDDFGKTVFLTREEAEKALKERENNG